MIICADQQKYHGVSQWGVSEHIFLAQSPKTQKTQPKSAVKKNSILIKIRRSTTTSYPPLPPPAAVQSLKH
jgi:hypothetical protein